MGACLCVTPHAFSLDMLSTSAMRFFVAAGCPHVAQGSHRWEESHQVAPYSGACFGNSGTVGQMAAYQGQRPVEFDEFALLRLFCAAISTTFSTRFSRSRWVAFHHGTVMLEPDNFWNQHSRSAAPASRLRLRYRQHPSPKRPMR